MNLPDGVIFPLVRMTKFMESIYLVMRANLGLFVSGTNRVPSQMLSKKMILMRDLSLSIEKKRAT